MEMEHSNNPPPKKKRTHIYRKVEEKERDSGGRAIERERKRGKKDRESERLKRGERAKKTEKTNVFLLSCMQAERSYILVSNSIISDLTTLCL